MINPFTLVRRMLSKGYTRLVMFLSKFQSV
jgi:hypothetical protein